MANDKRKYYKRWAEAQKELSEKCKVKREKFNFYPLAAKAIDNFEANANIYKELQYYKEEGRVLGEHPIFIKRNLRSVIDNMTMGAAAIRKSNLENYIRRDNRSLEKAVKTKNDEAANKLEKKVIHWQVELGLILAKLGG